MEWALKPIFFKKCLVTPFTFMPLSHQYVLQATIVDCSVCNWVILIDDYISPLVVNRAPPITVNTSQWG